MLIKTEVDITGALALTDLLLRKVPYVTNNSLTRTAKELVEVERQELKSEFQIRRQFILNRVKIVEWSRPEKLHTRVAIDKNVEGGALLLTAFEDGGEKMPELGSEIAVPLTGGAVRPTFASRETASLLYKRLKLTPHATIAGSIQYKGDKRTFVIPGIGVFQRISSHQRQSRSRLKGKGPIGPSAAAASRGDDSDIALLYRFKPEVPLRQQMHFVETAQRFVPDRFREIWIEEFVREMAGRARRR